MFRKSIATPCPIPSQQHVFEFNRDGDDTTTTLDFTSAFRPSLRNTKPRRPRQSITFSIHEDQDAGSAELKVVQQTSLAQPARRRISTHHVTATSGDSRSSSSNGNDGYNKSGDSIGPRGSALVRAPRRPAGRLSILPEDSVKQDKYKEKKASPKPVHHARRGTIYIPNEDTTMPSMYMGIFSPIKRMDVKSESDPTIEMTGIAAQMAVKAAHRTSMINAAPRRGGPLRPTLRRVQEQGSVEDKFGQGDGKENIPPGYTGEGEEICPVKFVGSSPRASANKYVSEKTMNKESRRTARPSISAPTASSMQKSLLSSSTIPYTDLGISKRNNAKPVWGGGSQIRTSRPTEARVQQSIRKSRSPPPAIVHLHKPKVPTRFVVPKLREDPVQRHYALISENISNPAMYEDDWLSHQESAITQLVNDHFTSTAKGTSSADPSLTLRQDLLKAYSTQSMLLMHKRLQAALLYGALSISQDLLDRGSSLYNDLGKRKGFTDLWLDTYDLTLLEAGLEVVVGRECRAGEYRRSSGATSVKRKTLQKYIETFLIQNEDGQPGTEHKYDRVAWSYRRTVLRSLMLVKILDLAKTSAVVGLPSCLFQSTSIFKDSSSILQTLTMMLNPTVGDSIRPLSHLEYTVTHIQEPMSELEYKVENLAVDLRDGVILTRLVELLLYPSTSEYVEENHDTNATTTILMPEGEALAFQDGQRWPLSQHLKFPCTSRATRLWNVAVALEAIKNVKGMEHMADGVAAEDIVDGFREKTIMLLWGLVGKWGLVRLVDWEDVKWEIRRLNAQAAVHAQPDDFDIDDATGSEMAAETCRALLRRWTRSVAMSRGIVINNFTTSFADGKVFESIIAEYEIHLQGTTTSKNMSLTDRLLQLGCSAQFACLFTSVNSTRYHQRVFDRDFVLAALAFLCSRLLAPTRKIRAAISIQQAWRKYWSKIDNDRKEKKKIIALEAVELVRCKQRSMMIEQVEQTVEHEVKIEDVGSPMNSGMEEDIWLSL